VRANVSVGLAYLASWLAGNGAAGDQQPDGGCGHGRDQPLQLWQWRVHGTPLDDGQPLTADRYAAIRDAELATLRESAPDAPWTDAAALLDDLVLSDDFAEFLTLGAYERLG
jgi:malate synthase